MHAHQTVLAHGPDSHRGALGSDPRNLGECVPQFGGAPAMVHRGTATVLQFDLVPRDPQRAYLALEGFKAWISVGLSDCATAWGSSTF